MEGERDVKRWQKESERMFKKMGHSVWRIRAANFYSLLFTKTVSKKRNGHGTGDNTRTVDEWK